MKLDYQVDMHMHTAESDGTWELEEVLENIREKEIGLFSITDHDSFENSLKMKEYLKGEIDYILGSEVSCLYRGQEHHILAYDFDPSNKELIDLLAYNRRERIVFNEKIVQAAGEIYKLDDISDYENYQYNKARGGWKSLNYLIDLGVIKDFMDYFEIVRLSKEKMVFKGAEEVIASIKSSGGFSFLAHPSAYDRGKLMTLDKLVEFKKMGIDGIECYSPYTKEVGDEAFYIDFCNSNNLMISAGSDCHGGFNNRILGKPRVMKKDIRIDFI